MHYEFLTCLQKGPGRWKVSEPYGCPENFRDSLTTPTATFPKIFSWALVLIDPMNVYKI